MEFHIDFFQYQKQYKYYLQLFGQYLKDFYDFISYTSNILECLYAQDFPEEYLLFEKENKNYIIIEKESQFKDTQDIQKQYNLNCITRR